MELFEQEEKQSRFQDGLETIQKWLNRNVNIFQNISILVGILAVGAYLAYALYYDIESNVALIVFAGFAIILGLYMLCQEWAKKNLRSCLPSESHKKTVLYIRR